MMKENKTSWEYQKGKYKQINIKFNMNDDYDSLIHWYLTCKTTNATRTIKDLVYQKICEEAEI